MFFKRNQPLEIAAGNNNDVNIYIQIAASVYF